MSVLGGNLGVLGWETVSVLGGNLGVLVGGCAG